MPARTLWILRGLPTAPPDTTPADRRAPRRGERWYVRCCDLTPPPWPVTDYATLAEAAAACRTWCPHSGAIVIAPPTATPTASPYRARLRTLRPWSNDHPADACPPQELRPMTNPPRV